MKGIYIIKNKINGKFYLGSSKNCNKRKTQHFTLLKHNTHHCIHLQRAYNKYGKDAFEFEILVDCEECLKEEQPWLDSLDWTKVYNVSKFAGGGDNISNHPNREEIVKKLTKILNDNRHKIKPRFKEENGNWKGGISIKNCISCGKEIPSKNKSKCNICFFKERDISGDKNPFKNKKHSEKTRKLISIQNTGKVNTTQNKEVIIENIEYRSLTEAGKALNVSPTLIYYRIKSKNKKFDNYFYKCQTTIETTLKIKEKGVE